MNKIRVGLIFGGRSGEHEVSIASAMSVYQALDKSRYDVTLIGIDKSGRWLLPSPAKFLAHSENPMAMDLAHIPGTYQKIAPYEGAKATSEFDVVLPILHGTFGEDGTIQGLLEAAQVPYAGSGVLGSAVAMDKDVASRLLKDAGLPVVPYICVNKRAYLTSRKAIEERILRAFSFPFFVKPANAGSSVGVHKVKSLDQLRPALDDAFAFDLKLLVQKGLSARELEASVLGNETASVSVVGEVLPRHEFYSYEAKYLDPRGADFKIPADIDAQLSERVRAMAIKAFQALECRGLARVDFFLDKKSHELYVNEINTLPGFTKISMYPKMWEASGLTYSALLDEVIRLAMDSFEQRQALKTSYSKT